MDLLLNDNSSVTTLSSLHTLPAGKAWNMNPVEAGKQLIGRYTQMLPYKDLSTALNDFASKTLINFAEYYRESKSILRAKDDSTYCPASCKVNFSWKATERCMEDTAYQVFSSKKDAAIESMNLQIGKLELEGRVLNNEARKKEVIEDYARALAQFSHLVLVAARLESTFTNHDATVELLLNFHHDVLGQFPSISVGEFTSIYKKVNKCGRLSPESVVEVVKRYYTKFSG